MRAAEMDRSRTRWTLLTWSAAVLLIGGIGVAAWIGGKAQPLPAGVSASEFARVAQKLRRSRSQEPARTDVLFQLGLEHASHQQWESAASLFAIVSAENHRDSRQARYLQAQSVLQQDRLRESERLFRDYLADVPAPGSAPWRSAPSPADRIQALHYLSYLLGVELRFDERRELLAELIEQGDADLFDTLARHFQSLMEWNNTHAVERLERACKSSPEDWQLQAVLARYWIAQGKLDQASRRLQTCRERLPHDLEIAAACLTCLEEQSDADGYARLAAELPPVTDADPVSLLRHRGQFALRQERLPEAENYFQRALARDPAQVGCRLGLGQVLLELNLPDRRKQELAVAQKLARIQNRLGWAASTTPPADVLFEIAQLSAEAGLHAAAIDVCRISIRQFDAPDRFKQLLGELIPVRSGDVP